MCFVSLSRPVFGLTLGLFRGGLRHPPHPLMLAWAFKKWTPNGTPMDPKIGTLNGVQNGPQNEDPRLG